MCPKARIIGKGSTVEAVICRAVKSTRLDLPRYQEGHLLCKEVIRRRMCPLPKEGAKWAKGAK